MTKHGISPKRSTKPSKRITMQRYNAKMDEIMASELPVHEMLIKMLEYTATVEIVEKKHDKTKNKKTAP